jgi:hypothetical protein
VLLQTLPETARELVEGETPAKGSAQGFGIAQFLEMHVLDTVLAQRLREL